MAVTSIQPRSIYPAHLGEIAEWQERYEACHFANFPINTVTQLDEDGMRLAARVGAALPAMGVGYYSNGLMKRLT